MRDECEQAVADALGRSLKMGEVKTIEERVSLHMRLEARKDPAAWAAMSQPERVLAAAKAAGESMIAEVQKKQQQVRLQIAAHDRIENRLGERFANMPENAKAGDKLRIVGQVVAFDTKSRGMQSTDAWGHAIANEAFGQLRDLWVASKGRFLGLLESAQGTRDILRELHGEDSGNPVAKAGAEAWRTVTDGLRARANAAGRSIGDLGDWWHKPQSHSQNRVGKAGPDQWIADTLPELDRTKYVNEDGTPMNDDRMQKMLLGAYDSITTDGLNKREPGAGVYGNGARSDRGGEHRVLFFKDSDSYMRYAAKYSAKSLWPTLVGHINAMARDIALAETLGPRDDQTFAYFNDRTRLDEMRENPTEKGVIDKAHALNGALYDSVAGRTKVVNQTVHDMWQAFRNFTVAKDLGMLPFTAMSDEAGMAATAWANKVPWTAGFFRQFRYLNPTSSASRAVAQHAGLGVNGMIGNVNRFGSENFGGGGEGKAGALANITGKIASFVMHATGMEAMWDGRRSSLGGLLMSYLGKVTREHENFSDLNQADHGILATKGVTENDWKVWKLAEPEDWGTAAHTVLTPKSIRDIPDEQLAELGDPDTLRRHASTMLLGHVLEETGMGVMDQGVRERTRLRFGATGGTHGGELLQSMMLFKGFTASMMMKHWARAGAMPAGANGANYVARLITMGGVMGALALQLANVATGKDPENMASLRFWIHSIIKGGGLGFYGDFMYNEMTQHDTSLVAAVGGPLITDAEQLWKLTGEAALKSAKGERVDEGAKAVRFVKDNIPVLNTWYLRAAANHLLWNDLQEAASPGYLDRMQARAYADRGSTYWWDPHEGTPARGPDLAAAWQFERGKEQFASDLEKAGRGLHITE